MVTASSLVAALGAVLLTLVVTVLCGRMLEGRFPRIRRQSEPRLWWAWMGGRVVLAPENPDFAETVVGDDFPAEVWGVVVGVVRKTV